MNAKKNNWFKSLAAALALGIAGTPGQVSSQEDEKVYELNPFTVQEEETVGYLATTTLAGTRINTPLRDIAASISVYTQEFIEDTGSIDITDLLVYAVGVEVDGMNGNFTAAVGEGNFDTFDFNTLSLQNQTRTRVRGLADADRTRNYFGSIIPMDTYNVERVVINRGANNILFGLGSPAGIINQGLAQPLSVDKNVFKIRTDDNGSIRGSFDVNRVFAEDKVRLRLIGLHNDQRYQQDPAYLKEQRIFGAVDFNLTETTILRINAEIGDMTSAPAVNGPPNDRFTNWWKPEVGKPTLPLGLDFRDRDFLGIDGTTLPTADEQQGFFDDSAPIFGIRPIRIGPPPPGRS
ncbi:MAG: TonB-dependent receptor plug domain-containing protein [Verrucomicrobia bacterium]|nr:TonB-dependent receptor plug domain-containing protein [Verrucomicrobiota bacterium]